MTEKRRSSRVLICQPAKIIEDRKKVHNCTVENLTSLGVCVQVVQSDVDRFPESLEFSFDNFHTVRCARVVWRHDKKLGLAFEPTSPSPPDDYHSRAQLRW